MYQCAIAGPGDSVQYMDNSDALTVYQGGSRSWRTGNPGLIGYGMHAYQCGAIGNHNGVAVFKDRAAGRAALIGLLTGRDYQMFTVEEAMRRFVPGYTIPEPPPPAAVPGATEPPKPAEKIDPNTNLKAAALISEVGRSGCERMADTIEREIGWVEGTITREAKDSGSLNQSQQQGSGTNVIINRRSAVHAGSSGTLLTPDVCDTPRGKGCPAVLYQNVAQSADASKTAGTVKINGNPACHESSIFAKSSGDEAGRCGGVRSGTTKAKAEFITSSNNVYIEGKAAVRQFDLMVSNNQNTPPAPLMQMGGAAAQALGVGGPVGVEPDPTGLKWVHRMGEAN